MTRTTMAHSTRGYVPMPYLQPRERESVVDAIDSGELLPVRDDETIEDLVTELADARRELAALTTIIGEVFAETNPADHRWKLEEAAADVQRELDLAIATAGEL